MTFGFLFFLPFVHCFFVFYLLYENVVVFNLMHNTQGRCSKCPTTRIATSMHMWSCG